MDQASELMKRLSDNIDAANKARLEGGNLSDRERELLEEYNKLQDIEIPKEFLSSDPEVRKAAFDSILNLKPEFNQSGLTEPSKQEPIPEETSDFSNRKKPGVIPTNLLAGLLKRI